MMDDEKIKDLFAGFDPKLSDSDAFVSSVMRGIDAVEIVKEQYAEMQRRQRQALIVASLIGVVVGIGLTILYMFLADKVAQIQLPDSTFIVRMFGLKIDTHDMSVDLRTPVIFIFAILASLTAVNTYNVSLSWRHRDNHRVSRLRESTRSES